MIKKFEVKKAENKKQLRNRVTKVLNKKQVNVNVAEKIEQLKSFGDPHKSKNRPVIIIEPRH